MRRFVLVAGLLSSMWNACGSISVFSNKDCVERSSYDGGVCCVVRIDENEKLKMKVSVFGYDKDNKLVSDGTNSFAVTGSGTLVSRANSQRVKIQPLMVERDVSKLKLQFNFYREKDETPVNTKDIWLSVE